MRRLDPTPAILEGFPFCIPRWEKQCADDYFKLGRTYRSGWGEISKVKQVRLYWHSEGVGLPTRVVNDIRSEGVAAERRVSVIKTARGLYFECVWTCGETWEMVLWLRFPSLQSSYSPWLLFIYFCFTKSMWYLFKGGGQNVCNMKRLENRRLRIACDRTLRFDGATGAALQSTVPL